MFIHLNMTVTLKTDLDFGIIPPSMACTVNSTISVAAVPIEESSLYANIIMPSLLILKNSCNKIIHSQQNACKKFKSKVYRNAFK